MKLLKTLLVLAGCIALSGCETTRVASLPRGSGDALSRNGKVYIVTPRDGSYGTQHYAGSGSSVAAAFEAAFERFSGTASVGPAAETPEQALSAARAANCEYAVLPKITHWEDRATEWSGIRDKMELFVKVIRVSDGAEIKSAEIQGKSSWFTFGGDHPQDLLKEPVTEFVSKLF